MILCACEESQAVTIEMRAVGQEAYSCDVQDCSGGHPEWHIKGDVLPLLNGNCRFQTMDGAWHEINGTWDMIIAHPPCTYLSSAGAVRLFAKDGTIKDLKRYEKGKEAAAFFEKFLRADCDKIAVENPTPLKVFGIRKYDQIIQPWYFGDAWEKRTCLWLKGLPALMATDIVEPKGLWVGSTSARRGRKEKLRYELKTSRDPKIRAKTFRGIARAMASQWGGKKEELMQEGNA